MKNDTTEFLSEYSRFLDSKGLHLTYAALSIYRNFDDELSAKEKQFLKGHLEVCLSCSERLQEVEETEEDQLNGTRFYNLLSPALFRYAIAALFVLAIVAVFSFYLTNQPKEEEANRSLPQNESYIAQTNNPERFVPNRMLENFVERNVRSPGRTRLISPKIGDTLTSPYNFRWEDRKKGGQFTLIILDNKNLEIWKDKTNSTGITVEKHLEPGLYYAKLESDGVLVQVGKFVVIR